MLQRHASKTCFKICVLAYANSPHSNTCTRARCLLCVSVCLHTHVLRSIYFALKNLSRVIDVVFEVDCMQGNRRHEQQRSRQHPYHAPNTHTTTHTTTKTAKTPPQKHANAKTWVPSCSKASVWKERSVVCWMW